MNDLPDLPPEWSSAGELLVNYNDMTRNVMAREKVLYEGHAVAAVAATSASVARRALGLIAVEYAVLPHVLDPVEAMRPDAPLLHDSYITEGVEPPPAKPSNVAKRVQFGHGDLDAGFAQADVTLEREFDTRPVHQGYIEPHACLASVSEDGQADLWVSTQGHFAVRSHCSRLLGWEMSRIRVTAAEIGGGFGGKTVVYLEPLALALSAKACQPVKMTMTREEVFRATGPTSGAHVRVKVGATRDGRITAADAELIYQAGAFRGSPVQPGAMSAFAPYELPAVRSVGYDVVVNRPKVAAYRAPGAPIAEFGVESTLDELARELGLDPLELRLRNAAREGSQSSYGPKARPDRDGGNPRSSKVAPPLPRFARAEPGPRSRLRVLVQRRRRDLRDDERQRGRHGGAGDGHPRHRRHPGLGLDDGGGGARRSTRPDSPDHRRHERARIHLPDRRQPGHLLQRHGRSAGGRGRDCAGTRARGEALGHPGRGGGMERRRSRAGRRQRRGLRSDEPERHRPHLGPDRRPHRRQGRHQRTGRRAERGHPHRRRGGRPRHRAGVGDALHRGPGRRARAVHPSYVEGQMQGGAVQGIGWALNEEYIYDERGRLENPGFLDYRMPVCSDVPMIDTVIVEVPNPAHPFGVRGVGETPIIPPMAAIANAVENAIGLRFHELPMSPPRVLKALDEQRDRLQAEAAE